MTTATVRAQNPFITLGLRKEALLGLPDNLIQEMVRSQYRVLAKARHPDTGGSPAAFRKLQWAFDELTRDETFSYWRNKLAQGPKSGVQKEESQAAALLEQLKLSERQNLRLWMAMAHPTAFGASAVHVRNLRILVTDILDGVMRSKILEATRRPGFWYDRRESKSNAYDLDIDARGRITRTTLKKVLFKKQAGRPEGIRPEWIEDRQQNNSYYWERTEQTQHFPGLQLVGSLNPQEMVVPDTNRNVTLGALLPGKIGKEHYDWVREGFPAEVFAPAYPFLHPMLRTLACVVACRVDQEKHLRFVILGQARAMVRTAKSETHPARKETSNVPGESLSDV